ncbi:MAG: geranylgeranyl reductase family protein [Bacteroidia bacterium]|nr:geranylgeranyl reductase family protein [Bacteroidia bacterium]
MKSGLREITILGAGPGGLLAAMFLAKAGIPSLVLEKETFPRDKICGDALSGKVVEILKKLDPALVDRMAQNPQIIGSYGVTFVAPNQKALRVPFKQDYSTLSPAPGFISKRLDYDHWLAEEARKNPLIDLQEGGAAVDFSRENGVWICRDKAGEEIVRSSLIIAADGAHSRFAKQVGGMKMDPKHYCAGLRAYYTGVKDLDPDNFIELHFLKNFLPGYFWIFPLANGRANVGVGMRSDKMQGKKINLKKEMLRLIDSDPALKDRFADAKLESTIDGYGLPLGSEKRSLSGAGWMLVGDAASLIDPFTGEGIGNAMYSGYFAALQAQRCLESQDFSAKAMSQYDEEVYLRLWDELKLSKRMQELVKYPWLFNLVVNKATKSKTLSEMISCMFEDLDLRDRLKSPSFYLKLLFNR